jgi:hypothetical protein
MVETQFTEFLSEATVAQAFDVFGHDARHQLPENFQPLGTSVSHRVHPLGKSGSRAIWPSR